MYVYRLSEDELEYLDDRIYICNDCRKRKHKSQFGLVHERCNRRSTEEKEKNKFTRKR